MFQIFGPFSAISGKILPQICTAAYMPPNLKKKKKKKNYSAPFELATLPAAPRQWGSRPAPPLRAAQNTVIKTKNNFFKGPLDKITEYIFLLEMKQG